MSIRNSKKVKRITGGLIAGIMLFGFTACSQAETVKPIQYGTLKDADVWGAPATEKVLQDVHGIYDAFRTDAVVDVTAARGEYESKHIIITAKDKPLKYALSIGDLKTQDGTEFPSENVEVFHEKYIQVKKNYDKTNMPTGFYPDALVPYENIVAAGENVVQANENQGLYFRFNVPIDQTAGTYTGTAKLTIGGETRDIPLSLTVADLTVSEEVHARSNFFSRGLFYKGELEYTQRMLDLYTEACFEYRIGVCTIVSESYHTQEEIDYYVDKSYEYMQNPKCSNIAIPYATETVKGYTCIKASTFEAYLKAFAKKSCENNYNMFKKLVCYLGIIDEPQLNGTFEALKVVVDVYRETLARVANEIEQDASYNSPIKAEIVGAMRKVRNTITTHYNEEFAEYIDTWCPMYHMYDGELIHNYDSQEERWWYGCISPRAPYPTYHIEDTLLSARAESWMRAEYGIVGNLYWGYDLYADYNGQYYEEIEDYYSGDAERYDQVNGDGFLFYPGKKYGIDGPIGSLRLEAIRDGLEEYELLYSIMDTYNGISTKIGAISPEKAFTSDKVVKSLTGQIYSGTRVSTTSAIFQTARESLFKIFKLTEDTEVCILDFTDDNRGTIIYKIAAPSDVTIKRNDTTLVESESIGAYKFYTIEIPLSNETNALTLDIEREGKTYVYAQELGGKASAIATTSLQSSNFTKETVTPTFTLVDGSEVNESLSGSLAKIDVPSVAVDKLQAFRMNGAMVDCITEKASKYVMRVYYDGTDTPEFVVSAKHEKSMIYYDLASVKLEKGINEIVIPLASKNWNSLGMIDYFAFYLGGKTGEDARSLYLMDSTIYNK